MADNHSEKKKNPAVPKGDEMTNENTKTEEKKENADALDSFLSREQDPPAKASKLPRSKKTIFILIGAAVAVAILVTLLIVLRRAPASSDDTSLEPAEISLHVTDDGMHEAVVEVDDKGEIKKNGNGELLSYVPSDIKQIDIENESGSFSVVSKIAEDGHSVYTIVGFEDYDLQAGLADTIASHCSSLKFTRVISADGSLKDYGLEKPRAKATVTYTDDTTALIRLGNDAAGGMGVYVAFGSNDAVYLADAEIAESFLYSVNGLISSEITETVTDSANMEFSSLTIFGTHFDEPITLVPNKDDAISATYLMTSPRRIAADAIESSDIAGNIRGLYAESVVCVNPSKDQMAKYGLSEPYASIKATYPDTEITLHASAPAENGIVHVYNPDKKVIYDIQLAAVCWAKTGVEALMPENPLSGKLAYVSKIDYTAGNTTFTIDVSTKVTDAADDYGNSQQITDTTATCNGKALRQQSFEIFFQNLNGIKNLGYSADSGSGKVMSVTLHYTTDREADTLTVYGSSDNTYFLELNGDKIGTVNKTYITKLMQGAENLIQDKDVEGL